jgi:transcriptional regulator with XRE-family HTH domain
MSDVVPLRNRMDEAEYDRERARLRETYGDLSKSGTFVAAAARAEQALALLFERSGWTQQELATKEGKSRPYIDKLLRFGRFLAFDPIGSKSESGPNNLTEGKFREYWERSDKDAIERVRFGAIAKMIQQELGVMAERRPQIGPKIKEHFADGQWHRLTTIANKIDADEDHIASTLDRSSWKNTPYNGMRVERKTVGKHPEYRIFRLDKTISSTELREKLTPIVKSMEHEGKASAASASPARVAILAGQLRKLLAEWTE